MRIFVHDAIQYLCGRRHGRGELSVYGDQALGIDLSGKMAGQSSRRDGTEAPFFARRRLVSNSDA